MNGSEQGDVGELWFQYCGVAVIVNCISLASHFTEVRHQVVIRSAGDDEEHGDKGGDQRIDFAGQKVQLRQGC